MAAAPGAAPPSTQSNTNKKQETFASKLLVPGGILLLAAGGAYGLLLWRRPRWLLVIPDDGISLAFTGLPALKEVKLGAPQARWLKYRPRVLDAWIEARIDRIRARFEALATVEQRRVFIPLPVRLGDKLLKELTPETYRGTLSTRRLTLITAEGGAGKTSLAFAIGRWGMEKKVVDHPVVPVLIEADLNEGETPLSRINRILVDLTDDGAGGAAGEPLSEAMVKALLARRRLLLIVDHYSELSDESRSLLNPTRDNFPVGWVIVTSRREENFQGLPMTVVTPQRLESNRLQSFFHDYLREKKRQEAEQEEFWDDDMLQRAQERLRRITEGIVDEKREITVLLARLYIDTVIAERREGGGLLPDSVPQLMRTYVDQINRTIEEGIASTGPSCGAACSGWPWKALAGNSARMRWQGSGCLWCWIRPLLKWTSPLNRFETTPFLLTSGIGCGWWSRRSGRDCRRTGCNWIHWRIIWLRCGGCRSWGEELTILMRAGMAFSIVSRGLAAKACP